MDPYLFVFSPSDLAYCHSHACGGVAPAWAGLLCLRRFAAKGSAQQAQGVRTAVAVILYAIRKATPESLAQTNTLAARDFPA